MSVQLGAFSEGKEQGRKEAIDAIVDYLRHTASGYALMRSIKANGARDALYSIAEKLEKDWQSIVLPRAPQMKGTDR